MKSLIRENISQNFTVILVPFNISSSVKPTRFLKHSFFLNSNPFP